MVSMAAVGKSDGERYTRVSLNATHGSSRDERFRSLLPRDGDEERTAEVFPLGVGEPRLQLRLAGGQRRGEGGPGRFRVGLAGCLHARDLQLRDRDGRVAYRDRLVFRSVAR